MNFEKIVILYLILEVVMFKLNHFEIVKNFKINIIIHIQNKDFHVTKEVNFKD